MGNLGTNPGFPQNLVEKRAEWVDHFSILHGDHQFKFGGSVIASWRFVTFFNNFAGTYTFPQGTPYPFNADNPATFPAQFTQTFGNSGLNFKDTMTGVFAQDDWQVGTGLTLNLGVRWDKDSLFQGDNNNFSPRAGFAWNIGNEGRTVIRGNTGIFYDTLESSAINRESNFGPVGQSTIDLRRGDPLFPSFPNRFDAFPTGRGHGPPRHGLRASLTRATTSRSASATSSSGSRRISSTPTSAFSISWRPTGRCRPTTRACTGTTCW